MYFLQGVHWTDNDGEVVAPLGAAMGETLKGALERPNLLSNVKQGLPQLIRRQMYPALIVGDLRQHKDRVPDPGSKVIVPRYSMGFQGRGRAGSTSTIATRAGSLEHPRLRGVRHLHVALAFRACDVINARA